MHCSVELVEGTQALDLHGSTCSDETVAEAASVDAALTDTDMLLPVISYWPQQNNSAARHKINTTSE